MDGEDFALGPSNPFVSPAPASRVEEGGWAGPSNPFLGTNGDGPLSFTSNPGTPGSRGYYDDDDNDAISPASGSMMDRTRSSLIAEQGLLALSDVDESDESDEGAGQMVCRCVSVLSVRACLALACWRESQR